MNNQNKILIQNTIAQYIKIIVSVLTSLLSTRIILQQLGVEDYGIFSVVAGFISLFGVLNSSMIVSVQRFISYEIPTGDSNKISYIYSTSVIIHIIIAFVTFVLCETIGLFFLKNYMSFPSGKLDEALTVYHCVVISFVINIISIPQQAALIAYEKLFLSAVIGIVEVLLKLIAAILLIYISGSKLICYSFLFLAVSVLIRILYSIILKLNVKSLRFRFCYEKTLYKKLLSFAGWNLFGGIANLGKIQGVNVILNMFFNTAINAAYGIANQVNSQLLFFSSSIFQSANSQIIQSYRKNDESRLKFLVFKTSKLAFVLYFSVALFVFISVDDLLKLWLGDVPEYCNLFIKLMLINSCIELFSTPLMFITQATGKIRNYFILISAVMLMILPISYVLLSHGFPPFTVLTVTIVINILLLIIRLIFVKHNTSFDIRSYAMDVILKAFMIIVISTILLNLALKFDSLWLRLGSVLILSPSVVIFLAYNILLSKEERDAVKRYVKERVHKKIR